MGTCSSSAQVASAPVQPPVAIHTYPASNRDVPRVKAKVRSVTPKHHQAGAFSTPQANASPHALPAAASPYSSESKRAAGYGSGSGSGSGLSKVYHAPYQGIIGPKVPTIARSTDMSELTAEDGISDPALGRAMTPNTMKNISNSGLTLSDSKARLSALREVAKHNGSFSQSAHFAREVQTPTMQRAKGLLKRVPSTGAMLQHTESRVALALSTKRLALQRQRRLNIKGDSFRKVMESIRTAETRESMDSSDGQGVEIPKSRATRKLLTDSLQANFLMSAFGASELGLIVNAMYEVRAAAGDEVVAQGDEGDRFFVIEQGDLDVVVDGEVVAGLGPGHHFGELALMYDCPRAASIVAAAPSALWCVNRAMFRRIILQSTNQSLADNRRWLRRVPLLSRLPVTHINRLADALQPVSFKKGVRIITQGEEGNIFYLVKSGRVTVTQKPSEPAPPGTPQHAAGEGDVVHLMDLNEGDYFGERALLTSEPRAASITAATDVTLMALDRDAFEELLGPLEDIMEVTHSQRRLTGQKAHMTREQSLRLSRNEYKQAELRTDCTLANLKTVAVLGEGAFGLVQLVEHKRTGELFALKQMQKARIVKTGQERNVCTEKRLLATSNHPYMLKLVNAFKDQNCLYMVLEFLQGGDMFGLLYKQGGTFDTPTSVFYAATVLTVFEYLHGQHVAYRDLKPENLVLDSRGYLKMVDFGFAKVVRDRTYTLCGTPEYLAPELVQGKGHNQAVDYWALGILIYEMLQGYSPFADEEHNKQATVYKKIIRGKVVFSSKLRDTTGINLIMKLLVADPTRRLGSGAGRINDVMKHRWFKHVDWQALKDKKVLPPIIPAVKGKYDLCNFDDVQVEQQKIVPYKDNGTGWDDNF